MNKTIKIIWATFLSLLAIGIFATTCTLAYLRHWRLGLFWWSWFIAIWVFDIFVGGSIFYRKNRTDETKTFWLFIMVVLPLVGGIIALIGNSYVKTLYSQPKTDQTKLLGAIFRTRKSIKIYSNSLFISEDTFNALNFVKWKGVTIQVVLSVPKKKRRLNFLIEKLRREFDKPISLCLVNKQITKSFIIFDDDYALTTSKNFNFRHIYSEKNLREETSISQLLSLWNKDIERSSEFSFEESKKTIARRIKFNLTNIFYPFL